MTRRFWFLLTSGWAFGARAQEQTVTLRGKLVIEPGRTGVLTLASGKTIALEGDSDTLNVLRDARLNDADFEVLGQFTQTGVFRILPIHKRVMYVHRQGKRLFVTYWCAVCAIRTFSPGKCWCCQEETALDLREDLNPSDV